MKLSDDLSELEQGLREAGPSGRQLRYALLRPFSELVQRRTCSLASDVQGASPAAADTKAVPPVDTGGKPQAEAPVLETNAAPPYVDASYLRNVRMEALEVFEARPLSAAPYVALWIDAVPGRSLLLGLAATADGYRHVLDFADASLQAAAARLSGLLKRGLRVDGGLLCITPGTAALSRTLAEQFGAHMQEQHCQRHKRERVVSVLSEADRRRVRGAITRAFQCPDPDEARAHLLRIQAELKPRNRTAARWLLQELDRTLTLHRTGRYAQLSPSLRGTGCVAQVARPLFRSLPRRWRPPQERRGHMALRLLEMESRLRRLAHASQLLPMRSALFGEDGRPLHS